MTLNIIIGPNRVEYIQVKKRDMKKHWFSHREQMYMTYPEHRGRIDMTDENVIERELEQFNDLMDAINFFGMRRI